MTANMSLDHDDVNKLTESTYKVSRLFPLVIIAPHFSTMTLTT